MNRVRLACVGFGVVFGFLLSWGRLTDPEVIRRMLTLRSAYVFLMMLSAVLVGFAGVRLARRALGRAVLTGERIDWSNPSLAPRHIWGSALFGLGWSIADACPGPITAQLGQGLGWAIPTSIGVVGGVALALRRRGAPAPRRAGAPLVPASAPE